MRSETSAAGLFEKSDEESIALQAKTLETWLTGSTEDLLEKVAETDLVALLEDKTATHTVAADALTLLAIHSHYQGNTADYDGYLERLKEVTEESTEANFFQKTHIKREASPNLHVLTYFLKMLLRYQRSHVYLILSTRAYY